MLTQASQAQCLQASIHEAYALPLLQENIWLTIPISHQFLVRPKYVSKGNHPSWRIVTLVSLSEFKQRLLLPLIVTSWLKSNVKRNWFRSSIGYAASYLGVVPKFLLGASRLLRILAHPQTYPGTYTTSVHSSTILDYPQTIMDHVLSP
jgi:hypothetical protein